MFSADLIGEIHLCDTALYVNANSRPQGRMDRGCGGSYPRAVLFSRLLFSAAGVF
jgi:hypothetical protein